MIVAGLRPADAEAADKPSRHSFWVLAVTGLATSIDALVVGVSLAFLDVAIVPVAVAIGLCTS
jgi:putative Mn2+ efflux pump MntP